MDGDLNGQSMLLIEPSNKTASAVAAALSEYSDTDDWEAVGLPFPTGKLFYSFKKIIIIRICIRLM